ncbi:protein kinase-like domain, Concanavalin A-like lectin/glucanase domain protein [Artemisia annua]|uniref:Protein kinase-like domain, Concanavalin A-like lectin/glucanase domain protein n=1 Tax=Artemisia annua TaxID=35608 RepID=A0A2U1LHJ2_ARTAN|nr:protein kinase-like domain, Concanavalin A-like lectin/glucanase domain protein [Artemisia annua]
MSSVNHDDFAHLKIPLEDVLSATNNFSDQNICGEDAFETYYKVQLSWSGELINIYAGRLKKERFDGDQQFWMEVSMLSSLKHKNLVSFVGFCDDNDEKITIIRRETRGSLISYLSYPMMLTWVRRLEISVGIAQALSYIYYDESRDFSVIHRNINSSLIYLNDDWEPKLGDFILSMKIKASERHNSFSTEKVWSMDGYTDPTYIETKSAHHKSDIYSFGIVLFELLCGRKAVINHEQDNKYLASVAVTHYREKKLNEIIDWDLWSQMDSQSFNIFAETAYDCLNEKRWQRPNIDEIVTRLERALELQLEHQNAIMNEFAHLRVPLQNILSATNNFAQQNLRGESGFDKRYKGQLLWSGELIDIYARRFNKERKEVEQLFWMEISMLSSLKHKNVVSLVGFCDDNDEKIIIIKSETRGSLSNHLSDPMLLTWVRRLEISVGIAHALSYIHYDEPRDFSVIHRDIDSITIVLNDDWEPKLSHFECSMKIQATQRHLSFHTNKGKYEKGYGDPTYIETKRVSHKSDIYSFGIVLFELLCGRTSIIDDQDNKYLAPVAIFHYKKKILDEIIDPVLGKQMDPQSFNVFAAIAYDCLHEEPSKRPNVNEIVSRLEKALELQLALKNIGSVTFVSAGVKSHLSKEPVSSLKDLSHLRLSYEDIKSATNDFADEIIITESEDVTYHTGRLLHSGKYIDIIAKSLCYEDAKDESKKFWTEILMLSSLNHKNLVSVIGFCEDEYDKIILYKKEAKESLERYLNDQTLSWMQRLKICVRVANALSYIHYDAGRDFSVIHCNIRSSNILLDDKWEPKLSGFELSLKNTVARRHRLLLTRDIVKNVYTDPKYEKTGGVTHKSDVYSFGVVLLEVLCGRSANDEKHEDEDEGKNVLKDELREGLLSQLAKSHLEDMIDPHLRKQMEPESLKIFSETAYGCIKEERADRPYIDQVVKRLEKALELQSMYENPELPRNALDSTSSNHQRWKNLEHLKIGLNDIELATENFSDKYRIGSGAFGVVYKARLEHFDSSNSSSIDGENKCGFPKKQSPVAIKRINSPKGEQGFNVEIEALTSCKHKNIISLLGFCDEGPDHMILVYELASKGSLEDYLGSRPNDDSLDIFANIAFRCLAMTQVERPSIDVVINELKKALYCQENHTDSLKLSLQDIKLATETFNQDNLIGHGDFGNVYKGHTHGHNNFIAAKRLGRKSAEGEAEFVTELEILMEYKHENVIGLVGYCDEEDEKIIENHKDSLKLSLQGIKLATKTFNQDNLIGHGDFGNVYKGHSHGHNFIAAKRLGRKSAEGEAEFMTELEILMQYKHENVIGLEGYCDEEDEKIIVYEYASRGSLDKYLTDDSLTWVMRLKICIDIAIGLEFLHGTVTSPEMIIHRDISSSNILLFDDWKAKISDFGLSLVCPTNQDVDYVIDNVTGTIGYRDPLYSKTGFLTKESDIFSLGAVLFDILCGKLSSVKLDDEYLYLPFLAKQHYHLEKLDELVFEGIKEQIVPESYITFTRIALQCLHHRRERRPTADEVVIQLKKALEFQVDYEKWEPKLPTDYKEIIQKSKYREIYSIKKKEELYNIFSKGILLQQDKVLLSFVGNGERNEMVSATMFSYINSCPHEWKSIPESRFGTVVEMLDISDLNIEIKTRAQYLSLDVVYGVYLVFKFCDSRNFSSKPMYVNLNYKKGDESLHAYFATWRDEQWMMIELYRFLNQNEDVVFEFLVERFSSYYFGDAGVYVEGVEFRAIDKVKHEEIGKLKEVQQVLKSDFDVGQARQLPTNFEEIFKIRRNYDDLFWLGEVEGKKLLLSEKCQGLHCPVKVQDVLHKENNEAEFVYFITPSPLNTNDITRVPKQREDGWMEIQLWKFSSTHAFKDDSLSMSMKFTSHEGPMSGLIVCGLEFRPMFSGNNDDIQRQREKKKRLQDEVPTHSVYKRRKDDRSMPDFAMIPHGSASHST